MLRSVNWICWTVCRVLSFCLEISTFWEGDKKGNRLSDFTDSIRDSNALSNLRECITLASELSQEDWDDRSIVHLLVRASSVCGNIEWRLTVADKNLVPRNRLDQIASRTRDVLNNFRILQGQSPNGSINIDAVNELLDNLLLDVAPLPAVPIRSTAKVLQAASEQFERAAGEATGAVRTEAERTIAELNALEVQIQRTASEQTDLVNQLRERIEHRANESQGMFNSLQGTANEATERLEREVTSIQEVFRESQRERDEAFQNAQNERNKGYEELVTPIVEDVAGLREQARSMLEEVAGASSAEHYAKQRDIQRSTADHWRRVGFVTFALLFAFAVGIFIDSRLSDVEFSFVWLAARSGILLSLGTFAAVAFRQAGQHRRREVEMSRVSNELMLLGPFMNRLPTPDRQALLREITPLYFNGGISAQDAGGSRSLAERAGNALRRRGSEESQQ